MTGRIGTISAGPALNCVPDGWHFAGGFPMDHASNVVLDSLDFTPETLLNAEIFGDRDHKIGYVSHVHGLGTASEIIIDVGGFLGLGAKSVMMPARDLIFMRDDNGSVHGLTSWTKDEVRALPEHNH
jgi:hypothetical protein